MNNARRKWIRSIMEQIETIRNDLNTLKEEDIDSVLDEEQEAYDNLPESIQESERGEALSEAIGNLEEAVSNMEDVSSYLDDVIEALQSALGE